MESKSNNSPLIVIVGETASGKSALAMRLAEKFGGEIICADSWTVRREVNIGTAKPSAEDRARIPHHLLDLVEPCQEFTAAVFQGLARQAITDISSRGKLPIMVGGTGLYIDGVIFDYSFLDEPTAEQRSELNSLSIEELLERAEKAGLDADGIDKRNKRRIMRLIETEGAQASKRDLRTNTLVIGLEKPREELRERVTARVDQMLIEGLEREVRILSERYGWECEALKGIGYREWREYFDGSQDLEQTRARIISSTMGLAKRQRTWFNRNKSIHWLSNTGQAESLVAGF